MKQCGIFVYAVPSSTLSDPRLLLACNLCPRMRQLRLGAVGARGSVGLEPGDARTLGSPSLPAWKPRGGGRGAGLAEVERSFRAECQRLGGSGVGGRGAFET